MNHPTSMSWIDKVMEDFRDQGLIQYEGIPNPGSNYEAYSIKIAEQEQKMRKVIMEHVPEDDHRTWVQRELKKASYYKKYKETHKHDS